MCRAPQTSPPNPPAATACYRAVHRVLPTSFCFMQSTHAPGTCACCRESSTGSAHLPQMALSKTLCTGRTPSNARACGDCFEHAKRANGGAHGITHNEDNAWTAQGCNHHPLPRVPELVFELNAINLGQRHRATRADGVALHAIGSGALLLLIILCLVAACATSVSGWEFRLVILACSDGILSRVP